MDKTITVEKNGILVTVHKKRGEMNKELYTRAWDMIQYIPKYNYNKALVLSNRNLYKKKGCIYD
jgi:hypothetical protein